MSWASNLSLNERSSLEIVLRKYEKIFDGTLGRFNGPKASFGLEPNVSPVQSWPFPVPVSHRATFKKELDRLEKLGVLEKTMTAHGMHLALLY